MAYFTPDQPSSRVHDWNLTLEKEVMTDTVVRAGYVGNHATHQDSYEDLNPHMPDYVWYMTKKLSAARGPAGTGATAGRTPTHSVRLPPGIPERRLGQLEWRSCSNSSAAIRRALASR